MIENIESNTSVVGHPKFDYVYSNYDEKNYNKKYIIYAPHHSFNKDSFLHFGTFDWNGKYILKWAKSHPELNWVFKPHPQLKSILLEKEFMTENEVEQYYKDWADLGIYYGDGNYFDLFKNSTCLITDFGSFLTEYFPTKNPVIHLRNPEGTDYTINHKIIMNTYYDVWNITQLQSSLEDILIKGNDPKQEERLSLLNKLKIGKENSSNKIINELRNDLKFKIIITYGTFDVLHYGHINLLKRARSLGNYLIVGLSTDEFNLSKHKKSFYSYEQRKIILEACKYVDLVIPEQSWEQKISDIKKYQVDIFTMGSDWINKFDYLKSYCEVVYLERTLNVCSTKTKEYLKNRLKLNVQK